jgi:regulatory protein YycI of two-component signal transduction system YycFG
MMNKTRIIIIVGIIIVGIILPAIILYVIPRKKLNMSFYDKLVQLRDDKIKC